MIVTSSDPHIWHIIWSEFTLQNPAYCEVVENIALELDSTANFLCDLAQILFFKCQFPHVQNGAKSRSQLMELLWGSAGFKHVHVYTFCNSYELWMNMAVALEQI